MGRADDTTAVKLIRLLARSPLPLAQSLAGGARPALLAAGPDAVGGGFYGPGGPMQLAGAAKARAPFKPLTNESDAARLWELSEELTGVRFA